MTSEYHKIETLYERDEKTFKIKPELILKNRVYGIVNPWVWTEKVDGTNIRLIWEDRKLTFGGKTDNAQIPAELIRNIQELELEPKLANVFPDTDAIIYGEGYGPGIQKGGGDYIDKKSFIAFDVLVARQWWLSQENVEDVARQLGLDVVPVVGTYTLAEATRLVRAGLYSNVAMRNNKSRMAEGLVGRPNEALFDKKGHRLIVKLKTKDF